MTPVTDECARNLAQMDTEAKGLCEELNNALNDLADVVGGMLGAMERLNFPSSGSQKH